MPPGLVAGLTPELADLLAYLDPFDDQRFLRDGQGSLEYLLFHYGKPDEVLPWEFGPTAALDYPVRCVTECVDAGCIPANARALDLAAPWAARPSNSPGTVPM